MQFSREDERMVAISGLNLFLCELILQIPVSADPEGSEAAAARLYSSPTSLAAETPAADEAEFAEDWAEYVQPDLRQHFASALEVVQGDLADFPAENPTAETHTLRLPVAHLESWINALNQARLALGARYEVTEKDMRRVPREGDARALALFQIDFYAHLQEWFIYEISG